MQRQTAPKPNNGEGKSNIIEFPDNKYWRTSKAGKQTFNHVLLGQDLYNEIPFLWHAGELHYYKNGVYIPGGVDVIAGRVQKILREESSKKRKSEVIDWVETEAKEFRIEKEEEIAVNGHLDILNLKNGLYNFKKHKFVKHNYSYYSTIQIPVNYNPNADCPEIKKFLESVVPKDSIPFVFEWFGYSLLREYKISKALMLYGTGGNGKSVFINLYNRFLGKNNVSSIDLHSLENNRFAPSRLYGRLANTFADIDSSFLESSKMIKSLTGNDDILAEFKGKDIFEFKNFAKLVFSANKLPGFKDTTEGNFDRWAILPFPNRFRGTGNQDINLLDKITTDEELSGLLNEAILSLEQLLTNGKFSIGKSMQEQIDKWQNQTDSVKIFIDDLCVIDDNKAIEKKELYREYKFWCQDNGYKALKVTNFYERMKHHGFEAKQSNSKALGRKHYFHGIHVPKDY